MPPPYAADRLGDWTANNCLVVRAGAGSDALASESRFDTGPFNTDAGAKTNKVLKSSNSEWGWFSPPRRSSKDYILPYYPVYYPTENPPM